MTKADADKLEKSLQDWSIEGDWETFNLFKAYERSGYTVLPHGQGWLDEPEYIIHGFETLLAVKTLAEYRKMERQRQKQKQRNRQAG